MRDPSSPNRPSSHCPAPASLLFAVGLPYANAFTGVAQALVGKLVARLAKVLPLPRLHRRRYEGVFAPNSPLRPEGPSMAVRSAE